MSKKDDIRTFLVIILVCIICVVIALLVGVKSNVEKLEPVKDYDVFFSNVNNINKYINYISIQDSVRVYGLLDERYIEENDITVNNVLDKVQNYSNFSSVNVNDMWFVQVGKNYIYYIEGNVYENKINGNSLVVDDDFSIIIIYDDDNSSYSLYPVDDNDYIKIINGIKRIRIDKNEYNSLIQIESIDKEQICVTYLSAFYNKLTSDINGTYGILGDDMIKQYLDISIFTNFIRKNIGKLSPVADKCKLDEYDENRVYTVIDSNGNKYVFTENHVMNYKVDFYLYENF